MSGNLHKVKFSLPLWPGLSAVELTEKVIPVLKSCKQYISDIYFTSRIAPFGSDAMGGIIVTEEVANVYKNAKFVSVETGIPLSATYNNIQAQNDRSGYDKFCKNFRPLYEDGCKIVTMPFTSWLRFGLKKEFPDLFVKNTIIHKVSEPAEVAKLFGEGFDYINLDRNLMRNQDRLKEISAAKNHMMDKLGKKLYLSLLFNEMCDNYCPVQEDHYTYNFNRTMNDPAYFASSLKETASCVISDDKDPEYILRTASIPAYYSQIEHYTKYIDVFKMHGRESKNVFFNSLHMVQSFSKLQFMDDPFRRILKSVDPKLEKTFLSQIKNCKFNCWKCNLCSVVASKFHESTSKKNNDDSSI